MGARQEVAAVGSLKGQNILYKVSEKKALKSLAEVEGYPRPCLANEGTTQASCAFSKQSGTDMRGIETPGRLNEQK